MSPGMTDILPHDKDTGTPRRTVSDQVLHEGMDGRLATGDRAFPEARVRSSKAQGLGWAANASRPLLLEFVQGTEHGQSLRPKPFSRKDSLTEL